MGKDNREGNSLDAEACGGLNVKYIHYGHKRFSLESFQPVKNEPYHNKPRGGLWASPVDAPFGWKDWCEAEEYAECDEANSFTFTLNEKANVYLISFVEEVKAMPSVECELKSMFLPDFEKMLADGWDAIEFRLSEDSELYWALYGWDCDSILVMNPDVVEEIR